jgi:hypothetical protein
LTEEKEDAIPKVSISTNEESFQITLDEDDEPGVPKATYADGEKSPELNALPDKEPGSVTVVSPILGGLPKDFLSISLLKGYLDFFRDDSFSKRELTKQNMITGILLILVSAVLISFISNVYAQTFGYGGFSLRHIEFLNMFVSILKGIFTGIFHSIILAGVVFGALSIIKKDTTINENLTLAGFIAGFSLLFIVLLTGMNIIKLPSSIIGLLSTASSLLPFAIVITFLTLAKGLTLRLALNMGLLIFVSYTFITRLLG